MTSVIQMDYWAEIEYPSQECDSDQVLNRTQTQTEAHLSCMDLLFRQYESSTM